MTHKTPLQDIDDQVISNLVRSVRHTIPDTVEEEITMTILNTREKESRFSQRFALWFRMSLTAAVVMTIIAAMYLIQPFSSPRTEPTSPISEIKTEFVLTDKNIKILWVQKKDFQLIRRQEQ
jgi:hypothetical protein